MNGVLKNIITLTLLVFIAAPQFSFAQTGVGVAPAAVSGRITDPEGRPLQSIGARVIAYEAERGDFREVFVGSGGDYALDLTSGAWVLFIDINPRSGFIPSPRQITLVPQEKRTFDIRLERAGGIITGKIERAGGLLTRTLVNVVSRISKTRFSASNIIEGGEYLMPVPAGEFSVEAFVDPNDGVANPAAKQLSVSSGELAVVSLSFDASDSEIFGSIFFGETLGHVTNGGSGVSIFWRSKSGHRNQTVSQKDGSYRLKVLRDTGKLRAVYVHPASREVYQAEAAVDVGGSGSVQKDLTLVRTGIFLPAGVTKELAAEAGGSVRLSNGMTVLIPGAAVPGAAANVVVTPSVLASPTLSLVSPVYDIRLTGADGVPVENLSHGAVIAIPYTPDDLKRIGVTDESRLRIAAWDAGARAWRFVNQSFVDQNRKIVLGYSNFLAGFGVGESEGELAPPPPQQGSGGGGGAGGVPVATPPAITAPSIVELENLSDGGVRIRSFDFAVGSGEVHDIERTKVNPAAPNEFVAIAPNRIPNSGDFIDQNVAPGTTYQYQIKARSGDGTREALSPEVSITTLTDTKPPKVSANVSQVNSSSAEVAVLVSESAIVSVDYNFQGNEQSTVNPNPVNVAVFVLQNLAPSTNYTYRVRATDLFGNTTVLLPQTFTTLSASQPASGTPQAQPPPPAPRFTFTRNLTVGSRGDDVSELQRFLVRRGFLTLVSPTGYFGSLTKAALARYQAESGITPAAGYFGPITRTSINNRQ